MPTEKKSKSSKPIRDNLEAFSIAILMAVLFKYFAIEAYQIPTSSMQPTMMGSTASGVYDRILVDKIRYELFEPERWDIAVFRYPLRVKQNYVKRIVGIPGDHLRIAGGNIYQIESGDGLDPGELSAIQKPEAVQDALWREVFPARMAIAGETRTLEYFNGRGGKWEEIDGGLRVDMNRARNGATLSYSRTKDGGLSNRLYDGYSADIGQKIQTETSPMELEHVQDLRLQCSVTPEGSGLEIEMEIGVQGSSGKGLRFSLTSEAGKARIRVDEAGEEKLASEEFDLSVASGTEATVAFAHLDDRCHVWLDGDLIASLDTSDFKTLEVLSPEASEGRAGVSARIRLDGVKSAELRDLRIHRDQHYTTSSRPRAEPRILQVPQGQFFMMGDNTLQSVDSRDWQQLEVAVIEEDLMVDPRTHPDATRLRGNLRPVELSSDPDPDENPVPVMQEEKIVFTDHLGEVHVLRGKINLNGDATKDYGITGPWFDGGEEGQPWEAATAGVHFVPREHILGRALVAFWPVFPMRLGFYR
ncbi:MAG: signal peptidase I [Planctomycetota bacterium]|jgi:signal peptidase I